MSIETMTKLATITIGATSQSSIEFTNIPQTYTDLKVVLSARTDRADYQDDLAVQFNSDSTSGNHSWVVMWGNNSSGQSGTNTSDAYGHGGWVNAASATSSTFGSVEIDFPNYTGNVNKTSSGFSITENNSSTVNQSLIAMASNLYRSTAPITSLKFFSRSSTSYKFVQHSTATLYGIRNARRTAGNSIKATGGNISFDGTYVYHTFSSSGLFSPTQALVADCLVVAGGGGAGAATSSGGGAGGLSYQARRSVTSGNYTVTIGAGGASGNNNGNNSVFDTITSNGGGAGKGNGQGGNSGGSGGGGGDFGAVGSATQGNTGGATGYGNNGGTGTSSAQYGQGGGGGAGGVGGNGTSTVGGAGGVGLSGTTIAALNAIGAATNTGQLVSGNYFYAGGGGGGVNTANSSTGGNGGGGAGGLNAVSGTANTGGGGGGSNNYIGSTGAGGAGGSGIVIIRYKA